jgi:hypothetical protein
VLRAGSMSRFYYTVELYAYGFPVWTGGVSDELVSGGYDQIFEAADARRLTADAELSYFSMHEARHDFEAAIAAYKQFPQQLSQDYTGELYALLALDEDYFGEAFCSGVPLTEIVNGLPQYGPQLTTQQMFAHALADADSAVKYAVDTARFKYLAQVVRGRIFLNMAQFDSAAAAVAGVPTSFLFIAEAYNIVNQANTIGINVQYSRYVGVADTQGHNGLNFISSGDPRIVPNLQDLGLGTDLRTEIYAWVPYLPYTSPVPIENGVHARLIEAEAALNRGDVATWLTTLNTLRTDGTQTGGVYNPGTGGVAGLAPLTDPGTAAVRVDLTFRERAFWLFFTGHRLGDMRRLIRQYGRSQDAVFPVGPYKNNGTFGTDVNIAIPSTENGNPNFRGCLDRNP